VSRRRACGKCQGYRPEAAATAGTFRLDRPGPT
jgi:hypothetical protein